MSLISCFVRDTDLIVVVASVVVLSVGSNGQVFATSAIRYMTDRSIIIIIHVCWTAGDDYFPDVYCSVFPWMQRDPFPPDLANAACGPSGWNVEASGISGFYSSAGALDLRRQALTVIFTLILNGIIKPTDFIKSNS